MLAGGGAAPRRGLRPEHQQSAGADRWARGRECQGRRRRLLLGYWCATRRIDRAEKCLDKRAVQPRRRLCPGITRSGPLPLSKIGCSESEAGGGSSAGREGVKAEVNCARLPSFEPRAASSPAVHMCAGRAAPREVGCNPLLQMALLLYLIFFSSPYPAAAFCPRPPRGWALPPAAAACGSRSFGFLRRACSVCFLGERAGVLDVTAADRMIYGAVGVAADELRLGLFGVWGWDAGVRSVVVYLEYPYMPRGHRGIEWIGVDLIVSYGDWTLNFSRKGRALVRRSKVFESFRN